MSLDKTFPSQVSGQRRMNEIKPGKFTFTLVTKKLKQIQQFLSGHNVKLMRFGDWFCLIEVE